MFLDSKDAYVWIYDPTPWYYWVGGGAIVLITIAVCLFPLWPPWMRLGVHYLSIAAAGFLVFIIALGVVKYIIFALLFALSAGKLRFWIFPNLTEDVGFFESFWPIYDYTYTGAVRSKVPFIYYVSTCIVKNLIWLPNYSQEQVFFCQNKGISFTKLHFD